MQFMMENKGSCKFLAFADLHYCPGAFMENIDKRLFEIKQRAVDENVSFMVQLGDFLQEPEKNGWLAGVFLDSPVPAYSAIGNHCTDEMEPSEIVHLYKMPHEYYYFDTDGYRFLVLDPNYYMIDGKMVHFAPGQRRRTEQCWIPHEQLKWMEKTISDSPYPCVIFSHQSLERTDGIVNRDEAWSIITAANRHRLQSVILCVNGHYHDNYCTFVNDVCCLDLNSVSYHWTDVENHHYPKEYYNKARLMSHCLNYDSTLSAVITLKGTETIMVEGHPGNYLFAPDEKEIMRLTQRRLSLSRINVPHISSYTIDLKLQKIAVCDQ